jgi:hypothetical protein
VGLLGDKFDLETDEFGSTGVEKFDGVLGFVARLEGRSGLEEEPLIGNNFIVVFGDGVPGLGLPVHVFDLLVVVVFLDVGLGDHNKGLGDWNFDHELLGGFELEGELSVFSHEGCLDFTHLFVLLEPNLVCF